MAAEAEAAHDEIWRADSLACQGVALAYQGDMAAARAAADAAIEATAELGGLEAGIAYCGVGFRGPGRRRCCDGAGRDRGGLATHECPAPTAAVQRIFKAEAALAGGDLVAARRWADDAVSTTTGVYLSDGADDARPGGDRAG